MEIMQVQELHIPYQHKMEQQIRKYKDKIQDHRRVLSINKIAEHELSKAESEESAT